MGRDHYAALEISPQATQEEIKKAHRRLVRQFHPDARRTEFARERFHQIQEAYEVLSDPKRRAQYDRQRRGRGVATYRQNQAAAERQQRVRPQVQRSSPTPPPPVPPITIPAPLLETFEKFRARAVEAVSAIKKIDWKRLRTGKK